MEQAILITPQGERIALPPRVFAQIIELLAMEKPAPRMRREQVRALNQPPPMMTREEINKVIRETRGSLKVKSKRPLTEALLEFRREEREREDRRG